MHFRNTIFIAPFWPASLRAVMIVLSSSELEPAHSLKRISENLSDLLREGKAHVSDLQGKVDIFPKKVKVS